MQYRKVRNDILKKDYTWYMQVLLNRIYSQNQTNIDTTHAQSMLVEILAENEATYLTYCKLIPVKQLALLKAIAAETAVSSPTASGFISKHRLGAASTVLSALKSLLNKELLFENNGLYLIYDRFFRYG